MSTGSQSRKGQAVVLVTLALIAMMGLIGLAVDAGWMFYVKRQAQTAADAAAMASVQEALYRLGGYTNAFVCPSAPGSTDVFCAPEPIDCSAVSTTSNLYNGCQYAARDGFASGGGGNRQRVTIQANDHGTPPPTVEGVSDFHYWTTVRAVQSVPQVFSAVLGNTQGTVAARATAAIVNEALPGSVYALNREVDCIAGKCGTDIDLGGNSTLTAPGGVTLASACNGPNHPAGCGGYAGEAHGSGATVTSQYGSIITRGGVDTGSANWTPTPITGAADGRQFRDPTQGWFQPPILATAPVKACGVLNGEILAAGSNAVTAGPYNYYSYHTDGSGHNIPDGRPIRLGGDVTFTSNGPCPGVLSSGGSLQSTAFPTYFFYGGMNVDGASATFGPGQYVMAGAAQGGGGAGTVFNVSSQGIIQSSSSALDFPGNMFIFTAPGYPGLSTQIDAFPELQAAGAMLYQGTIDIQGGSKTGASLNGVVKGAAPSDLDLYNGILFWQDRRNSTVQYNANGTIANAPATGAQMQANRASATSPEFSISAAPKSLSLTGVIYQPRGAWMTFQGHGGNLGSIQIITGAVIMSGGGDISMTTPTNPLLQKVCALIE